MKLHSNRPKYGNKKVVYDNIKFDSEREMKRYIFLNDLRNKGVISNLEVHVKYELLPAIWRDEVVHLKTKDKIVKRLDQRAITYTADFRYNIGDRVVVEDVKISEFLLPKEYILKEYMMYYFHRIRISRVYKPTQPIQ